MYLFLNLAVHTKENAYQQLKLANSTGNYLARSTSFSSVQFSSGASMYLLRLMLVGVWLGLLWVLFYFFDHYIQSSGGDAAAAYSRQSRAESRFFLGRRGGGQTRLPALTGSSSMRLLDERRRDPGVGLYELSLSWFSFIIYYHLSGSIYAFWIDISVIIAMYDARRYLVWTILGVIFFLRSLSHSAQNHRFSPT